MLKADRITDVHLEWLFHNFPEAYVALQNRVNDSYATTREVITPKVWPKSILDKLRSDPI